MQVQVHGKQLSEPLHEMIERKVSHAARFFEKDDMVVDVEVSEEHNPRLSQERVRLEITVHLVGQVVRVEAAAPDAEAALDQVVDRFEKRLRRLKGRLIARSRRHDHKRLNQELVPTEEEREESGPEIVRVKQFSMKPMSPEEAALQMEMLDHTFFFFLNSETDLPSVIYRRRNGTYGLIEPA